MDLTSNRKKKVIIDTDAYNEIDDQFAVAYSLCHPEKMEVLAYTAAPFEDDNSSCYKDGMLKSFAELKMLLHLMNRSIPVYLGADHSISQDPQKRPVDSPAARKIIETVQKASEPIYILGIGAGTNIASALMMEPFIKNNMAVIWQGAHALDFENIREFNLAQDFYAAQAIINSGVPFVLEPANYVTSSLRVFQKELKALSQKNQLCNYLYSILYRHYARVEAEQEGPFNPNWWECTLWDLAAIATVSLPESTKLIEISAPIFQKNYQYGFDKTRHSILYLKSIDRDLVIQDCWKGITQL